MSEPKEFWIDWSADVSSGENPVLDYMPEYYGARFTHVIEKSAYDNLKAQCERMSLAMTTGDRNWSALLGERDRLAEINKVLVEALERTQKILQAYSDVKVESPDSSPNEEYLAFKGYRMNKEVIAKAKEMEK